MNQASFSYNTWNLGDSLLSLHLLRALAQQNREVAFVFFCQPRHIPQLNEVIFDIENLLIQGFDSELWTKFRGVAVDTWKNCEGFWDNSPHRWDWSAFTLDHHRWTSERMGFPSPFHTPEDLLFDYPALQPEESSKEEATFLIINSDPTSHQLSKMVQPGTGYLDELILKLAAKHSVVTTMPAKGALWSTLERGMTVSQVGRASHWFTHHIMIATGPMWPTLSKYNFQTDSSRRRVALLDNGETLNMPGLLQMASVEEVYALAETEGWI